MSHPNVPGLRTSGFGTGFDTSRPPPNFNCPPPSFSMPARNQTDLKEETYSERERDNNTTEYTQRKRSNSPRSETWRSSRRNSRSRSRSRSYSPRRRRRSRSRSRSRSASRGREEGYSRQSRSSPRPTDTIVMKGLPPNVDEDMVWKLVNDNGFRPKDVRIMMKRETGENRGFGFIEFLEVEDAQDWLRKTKGRLRVDEATWADMEYSNNRPPPPSKFVPPMSNPETRLGDWICAKCGLNNFKKRDQCFKCTIRRDESEMLVDEGFTQIGIVPCDTPSQSFAYVQMGSIAEATQLLTTLTQMTTFIIDGKEITTTYSKQSLSQILAGANLTQTEDGDWKISKQSMQGAIPANAVNVASVVAEFAASRRVDNTLAQSDQANSAAAVAQQALMKAAAIKHAQQKAIAEANLQQIQAAQLAAASALIPGAAMIFNSTQQLALRALQDAAMQQIQQQHKEHRPNELSLGTVHTEYGELPRYPPPDTSQYQYETKSGYYFDPTTGLYYDANSRYYLNAQTQTWLYWDAQMQTYMPMPTSDESNKNNCVKGETENGTTLNEVETTEKDDKEKQALKARKLQKDMERWAKAANKSKERTVEVPIIVTRPIAESQPEQRQTAAAEMISAVIEKKASTSPQTFAMDFGADNGSTISVNPESVTDWNKMACLLCRRQFPSKEVLMKHNNMSGLHKKNLSEKCEIKREASIICPPINDSNDSTAAALAFAMNMGGQDSRLQYRDRAKERRQKYGFGDQPADSAKEREDLAGPSHFEQPTAQGIKGDNIGNRMLKSMGWSEGKGLGKKGHGIVDPILAERRVQGAGLGASGSKIRDSTGGSDYKANLRQSLRERFFELDNQDK